MLTEVKRKTIQDRVQLPRLYLTWITPAHFDAGRRASSTSSSLLLAGGKNSRLYKRLVYDLQIAQDVTAFQASEALDSQFQIVVTARPPDAGTTSRARSTGSAAIVDEEIAKTAADAARRARVRARDQPDRVVVLRPDGAASAASAAWATR